MSFSSTVKNEVALIKIDDYNEVLGELYGLFITSGSISIRNKGIKIDFSTENAAVARRVFTFLRRFFDFDVEVVNKKSRQLKKNLYIITIKENSSCKNFLNALEFNRDENVFITKGNPHKLIKEKTSRKAFIRGAFLGSGSVVSPEKSYHLEFVVERLEEGEFLAESINKFGLHAKISLRKDKYIVYLKEAEQISDLLSLIGAYKSLLDFENTRVIKDMRNNVNRIVNCETANLNKIVSSSLEQVNDILLIDEKIGIDKLPDNLREIAQLRLENRTYSLKDIGNLTKEKISKSTVNYRFKKIKKIANDIRSEVDGK